MAITALLLGLKNNIQQKGFVRPDESTFAIGEDVDALHGTYDTASMALILDAMISEQPSFKAEPTVSQVSNGGNISDHVTLKPITLKIEGFVSDTPVEVKARFRAGLSGLGVGTSPSERAHSLLYKLFQDREPFDFVGGLQVYRNMVLTDYSPVRNSKTGAVLQFTATMQQVRFARNQSIGGVSQIFNKAASTRIDIGTQQAAAVVNPSTMPVGGEAFQKVLNNGSGTNVVMGGESAPFGAVNQFPVAVASPTPVNPASLPVPTPRPTPPSPFPQVTPSP